MLTGPCDFSAWNAFATTMSVRLGYGKHGRCEAQNLKAPLCLACCFQRDHYHLKVLPDDLQEFLGTERAPV